MSISRHLLKVGPDGEAKGHRRCHWPALPADAPWLLTTPPWQRGAAARSVATTATGRPHPTRTTTHDHTSVGKGLHTNKRKADRISLAGHNLGKLATATAEFVNSTGWHSFVDSTRGVSNLSHGVGRIKHKASRLLQHLRKRGASIVLTAAPWEVAHCDAAMARGPHKSAQDEREYVSEEILDLCSQGYWAVLPYSAVRHWQGLHVSPLGVVPQRDRRPRLIVDYSYSGVNDDLSP